ncbi:MAG TPA: response regulator transcription factor [Candidatus Ventrousia excrementavium]|uniref:Stage 0 sporulation protein A homolog n=1 Tax=Candidatus Ventrousia excrementavium TaxID=2840961 RepID=A0A9D1IWT3_9CLOT|nr:response regulator transcription factor [Candidatus Ventrousia excrementavium]
MPLIYYVEDDENIRNLVLYSLTSAGYEAQGFDCGEDFWRAFSERTPDLVLLDIMLPGQDGVEWLRRLREREQKIPVMMLTARSSEYDKVLGLDAGADDYLTKPFGVMELLSRVRALLRRAGRDNAGSLLSVGSLTLDPARRVVTCGDTPVTLTFKEFELLHYLLRNQSIVLSREKIMDAVWGVDYPGESRTVDMHIKSLRQKLGPCGEHIVTVRGAGYKIGGTV